MGSTILGPGTIFLMLVGAFNSAFGISNYTSFCYNLLPVLIFCAVCYFCTEKVQLSVAAVITSFYGLLMIVVLVGIMLQISEDGLWSPTTVLLITIVAEFVVTAMLHPLEFGCLKHATIYYVTVPSVYLLLIIFSLFNMNNISWGTRDAPKAPSQQELEQQQQQQLQVSDAKKNPVKNRRKEKGAIEFSLAGLFKCMLCTQDQSHENDSDYKEITTSLLRIEDRLEKGGESSARQQQQQQQYHRNETLTEDGLQSMSSAISSSVNRHRVGFDVEPMLDEQHASLESLESSEDFDGAESVGGISIAQESDSFLVSPNWLHGKDLGKGEVEFLESNEEKFWKQFISAYLEPIDKDEKREAEIAKSILDLRDQYVVKFFMVNALFVLTIFLMQLKKDVIHLNWPFAVKYAIAYERGFEVRVTSDYLHLEPIGFVFILCFLLILVIQFVAMLFHRFDTFSHIMAKVSLDLYCCDKAMYLSEEAKNERLAEKIERMLQRQMEDEEKEGEQSAMPPRKRMTVCDTIAATNRKQVPSKSLNNKLKESLEKTGKGGVVPKRISQLLQKKRNEKKIQQQQQQAQSQKHQTTDLDAEIYSTANNPVNNEFLRQRPRHEAFAFDNPALVRDDEFPGAERI